MQSSLSATCLGSRMSLTAPSGTLVGMRFTMESSRTPVILPSVSTLMLQLNWRPGQGGSVRWRSAQAQEPEEQRPMISGLAQPRLWVSVQRQSDLRQLTSDTILTSDT